MRSSSRPTNRMRKSSDGGFVAGGRGRHVDAVGDHVVVAAEVALARPARRFGDRDAGVQLVEDAPRAEQRCDRVRQPLGRIGVEGADHRGAVEAARVPADHRRDRLVDVHDVEAPRPQLAPQANDAFRKRAQVRDRSVRGEGRGAAERDQVIGKLDLLGAAPVEEAREPVVGVDRRQDANVVALSQQLRGQLVDVAGYPTRKSPRVWRDESDAHSELLQTRDEGRPLRCYQRRSPALGPDFGASCKYPAASAR